MIRTVAMTQAENALQVTIEAAPAGVSEPRKVGGWYWNGYFSKAYTVLAIETHPCGCKTAKHRKTCIGPLLKSITVRDGEGTRTHMTAFSHKWDGIVVGFNPANLGIVA